MSNTDQSHLGDFLDLTYSAAAATGLVATNELVQQLRAIPPKLLAPVLLNDRNRVLNKALPDLLSAHRDARIAGADVADADLALGLQHIRVEIVRIIDACRANAGDSLAIQSNYLADVYPVESDNPLAFSGTDPTVDKLVKPPTEGERRKLDRTSIEALFQTASDDTMAGDAPTAPASRRSPTDIALDAFYLIAMLVFPILAILGLMYGVAWLYRHDQPPAPTYRPDRVALTATIDQVRRSTIKDPLASEETRKPAAIIDLHGTIHNRTHDHDLQQHYVRIDLFACRNDATPLNRCSRITSDEPDITDAVINPGVTARWNRREVLQIPDVTGRLRAVVYPDISIFDDTPRS